MLVRGALVVLAFVAVSSLEGCATAPAGSLADRYCAAADEDYRADLRERLEARVGARVHIVCED